MEEFMWQKIGKNWPVYSGDVQRDFEAIRKEAESFLAAREVPVGSFSHYGLVVRDTEQALEILNGIFPIKRESIVTAWVDIYNVHLMRCVAGGTELEFIAPSGKSFFNDFLSTFGEGLQHVGFFIHDIRAGFEKLRKCGVILLDTEPRQGSHGKILFLKPHIFASTAIELCQKNQ